MHLSTLNAKGARARPDTPRLLFSKELQTLARRDPYPADPWPRWREANRLFAAQNGLTIGERAFGPYDLVPVIDRRRVQAMYRGWDAPPEPLSFHPLKIGSLFDHARWWRREGKPFCVTAHPYDGKVTPRAPEARHLQEEMPYLRIELVPVPSWYSPDRACVIVAARRDVLIEVE